MAKEEKINRITHQIYLERYKNNEVADCLSLLEKANKQMQYELYRTTGVYTKKRYAEISKELTALSKGLKESIDGKLDNPDFIAEELEVERKLIATEIEKSGMKLDLTLPTEKQIRNAVKFKPFLENVNYGTFLDTVEAGFYNTWDNAVRIGYLTGLPTQKIISSVMGDVKSKVADYGTIQQLRNSIERNTRTWLQSVANETRNEFFEENEKYIEGYEYLATLDRRTCLVCGDCDGKLYEKISDAPMLPQHYNCRCVLSPIIKGIDIGSGLRASENGYVSDKMTFDDWLKEQSEEVQKDVLGVTRYGMYQKKHSIGQFVADGKMMSLEELRNK